MRRTAILAVTLALLGTPGLAQTEQRPAPAPDDPVALAEQAAQQLLQALRLFLRSIPTYELPEMLDNGDIIIRRKQPGAEKPAPVPDKPAIDRT